MCGDDGCATRSSIRATVARASGGASVVLAAQQPQHLRNLRALDVYYDASEENNDEEVTFDDQVGLSHETVKFSDEILRIVTYSECGTKQKRLV